MAPPVVMHGAKCDVEHNVMQVRCVKYLETAAPAHLDNACLTLTSNPLLQHGHASPRRLTPRPAALWYMPSDITPAVLGTRCATHA